MEIWIQTAILSGLAFVPLALWLIWVSYKKKEKRAYIILTFVAGMLSVLPMKGLEALWNKGLFFDKDLHLVHQIWAVLQEPSLANLSIFIFGSVLVSLFFYFFVAFMMFFLEVLSGDNTPKVFAQKIAKISEAPFMFVGIGIIIGLAGFFSSFSLEKAVFMFVILGMLEEYVKHLVVRFSDEFKIHSVGDAIHFSIIAALGFAFVENIVYFHDFLAGGSVWMSVNEFCIIFLLRSSVSVMGHVGFSAIFGYFYGVSRFSTSRFQEQLKKSQLCLGDRAHQMIHCKSSTGFHEQKIAEGMLLAMILHMIYNLLLELEYIVAAVSFSWLLFLGIVHLFNRYRFNQSRELIALREEVRRGGRV